MVILPRDFAMTRSVEPVASLVHASALMIACADACGDPCQWAGLSSVETFVLRNLGNVVPPCSTHVSSEAATIEHAVERGQVRDIYICGHTHCAAVDGLLKLETSRHVPSLKNWLQFAGASVERAKRRVSAGAATDLHEALVEANVLLQVEHLLTYGAVHEAVAGNWLQLHACVFDAKNDTLSIYDPSLDKFVHWKGDHDSRRHDYRGFDRRRRPMHDWSGDLSDDSTRNSLPWPSHSAL